MAPARALRPHDVDGPVADAGCPFCPGNEAQTPPETLADLGSDGGWHTRAFPNRYPAVDPAEGRHEVIVNTARHVVRLAELDAAETARAIVAWADRLDAAASDARDLWPFLFLNQGAAAGASLQHTHAQVVGMPFAPPRLAARARSFDRADHCPLCGEIAGAGDRVIVSVGGLVAWCPPVPPLSGLVRIAPARHTPGWDDRLEVEALAALLPALTGAVEEAAGADAVNLWLHQRRPGGSARQHWHLELLARRGTLAGMELGTGVMAVAHDPTVVATRLRARWEAAEGWTPLTSN